MPFLILISKKNKVFNRKFDFLLKALEFDEKFKKHQVERILMTLAIKRVFGNYNTSLLWNSKKISEEMLKNQLKKIFYEIIAFEDLEKIPGGVFNQNSFEKSTMPLSSFLYLSIVFYAKNLHKNHIIIQKRIFDLFEENGGIKVDMLAMLLAVNNKGSLNLNQLNELLLEKITDNSGIIPLNLFHTICFCFFELNKYKIEGNLMRNN